MSWSVYLIKTMTGQIGPKIDPATLTWSISLNATETASVEIKKSSLGQYDPTEWLTPWVGGVLLKWGDTPIFAGPIIGRPDESFDTIKVDCAGIRSILSRRVVASEFIDWSQLAASTIAYKGMSLGTIAKRVVQQAQQKSNGSLPIAYPVPDQLVADDADHQRTYEGFNLQNLDVDSVLKKLSDVHMGPDIMFKPRLLNDSRLVWDLWTGTENQPRIVQNNTPVWDSTPVNSGVATLNVVSTGSYVTNRVYSIGDGTDQGTLITVSENAPARNSGMPLLESVIAISKSSDPNVVKAHGDGVLYANSNVLRELTMTVRADSPYPLGSYWSGDLVEIVVKGWISLSDGVHKCRLLNMSGDLFNNVRLSMQTEE